MNEPRIPRVGIIITNRNYEKWLEQAILSAANSDYPNINIYLADDGSDVEPLDILGKSTLVKTHPLEDNMRSRNTYIANGRQLEYIGYKESKGPSYPRNRLIDLAFSQGCHVISILDSDDYILPQKISVSVTKIMEDPEHVGLVYGDYLIEDVDNSTITYEAKPPYDYFQLMGGFCMIHSGSTINGRFLKPLGPEYYPEDVKCCEDFQLWRTIMSNIGVVAIHLSAPLSLVRTHQNNSTNSLSKKTWERDFRKVVGRT